MKTIELDEKERGEKDREEENKTNGIGIFKEEEVERTFKKFFENEFATSSRVAFYSFLMMAFLVSFTWYVADRKSVV